MQGNHKNLVIFPFLVRNKILSSPQEYPRNSFPDCSKRFVSMVNWCYRLVVPLQKDAKEEEKTVAVNPILAFHFGSVRWEKM